MKREELQRLSVPELVDMVLQLQQSVEARNLRHHHSDESMEAFISEDHLSTLSEYARDRMLSGDTEALDEELQQASLLLQLSIEFRETLEPSIIVERMLQVMAKNLGVSNASVVLVTSDGSVELAMSLRDGDVRQITSMVTKAVLDRGLAGWVLRNGRSVVLPDVSRDKRWIPYAEWQKDGSAIVLPIRQAQTALGVLTIYHPTPNHFSSRDLILMEGVAAQAGVAFGSARRYLEESQRREQALALFSLSPFLASERTYDDLATMIQEKVTSIFDITYGLLFLVKDEGNTLSPVSVPHSLSQLSQRSFLKRATLAAHTAWEKKNIVTDEHERPVKSLIALPLVYSGETIGAMVLVRTEEEGISFPANVWSMLTTFTNVVAATCANMRLVDQMKKYTETLEVLVEERTYLLQRSRDFLRVVFDNLTEGLVLMDTQEVLLAANNAFCYAILGRHPRNVVGENLPGIWEELEERGDLQVEVRSPTQMFLPQTSKAKTMRVLCTNSIGQRRWYEVTRISVSDDDDEVEFYVERWLDVTYQEELHRRMLLQDQQSILGNLTSRVVHDIDMPLQEALEHVSSCSAEESLSEDSRQKLKQAQLNLDRMDRTLKSLSHLYQSPKTTAWDCLGVNGLLQEIERFVEQSFEQHQVTINMQLNEKIPLIYGQRDSLFQVFLGIVFNAQEAMPDGGSITVATGLQREDEDSPYSVCHVSIQDTGVGMSYDQISQLFEPFHSNKSHGVGIGLYLSKQIIEQHSGTIKVSSKKREGTTVDIYLPWSERCAEENLPKR